MPDSPGPACLNCEAELAGPYCHRCGQEAGDPRMPLRALAGDALGDLFAFDSRVLRTLRPLLLRPGFLTEEWRRGRRAPYVPPLRLYVFVAAVFFLVMAATDVHPIDITETEPVTEEAQPGLEVRAEVADGSAGVEATRRFEDPTGGWIEDRFETVAARGLDTLQDSVLDRLGRLSLLLAPLSALLLAALYRRRYLVEHVVFSLHVHVFAFLLFSVVLVNPWRETLAAKPLLLLGLIAVAVYLFLAMRRVYGASRLGTAWRWFVLGFAYLLLIGLPTLLLAFLWALLAV